MRAARELLADRRHVRHDGLAMALGDSLASVQQRRGILRQELRHQTERREALERKRGEAVRREHELKLALQHECATGLRQSWERMAAELQAREASQEVNDLYAKVLCEGVINVLSVVVYLTFAI